MNILRAGDKIAQEQRYFFKNTADSLLFTLKVSGRAA